MESISEVQQMSELVDDADSVLGSPILAPAAFQNQGYQDEQIPDIHFDPNDHFTMAAPHEVASLPNDPLDNSGIQNRPNKIPTWISTVKAMMWSNASTSLVAKSYANNHKIMH